MSKKALAVVLVSALLFSAAVMLHPNNLVSANYIPYQPNALSASYLVSVSSSAGWNQTYGGADWDSAESVIQTSDGGYAIAGRTKSFGAGGYEFWLVKTDSLGNVEWNKTYGNGSAKSIVQTSDGGYVISGGSKLVKTDSEGNMQWNKTYGGGSANSMVQTSDGGYALAGCTNFNFLPSLSADFWLVKTDALGNMQWNKTYARGAYDRAQSVIQTSDGGYALVGITTPGAGEGDFLLVKTDSEGDMEWSKTYGSKDKDEGHAVVQTSDGGYALAGLMWNRSGGDAGIVKTDSVGNMQWKRNYDGGSAWSMALTSDGGYIIACSKLVKTDSEGNMQWNKTYGYGSANSVIQTSDGGYALAGIVIFGGISSDAWLIKTDSEGNSPSLNSPSLMPPEPFPTTWIVAPVVTVALVGAGLLFYFKKRNR